MSADVQAAGQRIARGFKRHELAVRLIGHRARTLTICGLTGLTENQLTTLRRRWIVPPELRHRGPPPRSLRAFFRTPGARSEGAALGVLCRVLGAVSSKPMANAAREYLSIETGERLCEVFEAYRACFPESNMEFDQVVLLASALAQGDVLALGDCRTCGSTILIDRLSTNPHVCACCELAAARPIKVDVTPTAKPSADEGTASGVVQKDLF